LFLPYDNNHNFHTYTKHQMNTKLHCLQLCFLLREKKKIFRSAHFSSLILPSSPQLSSCANDSHYEIKFSCATRVENSYKLASGWTVLQ
jgi:hypothetical protein